MYQRRNYPFVFIDPLPGVMTGRGQIRHGRKTWDLRVPILRLLSIRPDISYREAAEVLDISYDAMRAHGSRLQRSGYIERSGQSLVLTEKGRALLDAYPVLAAEKP